jgi:hypothetical protein
MTLDVVEPLRAVGGEREFVGVVLRIACQIVRWGGLPFKGNRKERVTDAASTNRA